MRGYDKSAPAPAERLTVGPGQLSLIKAIDQMKIAVRFLELRGTDQKLLRVDPFRYGVNFVSYEEGGKITSFVEVGASFAGLRGLREGGLPVVYPAAPFIAVPVQISVQYPLILVCQFADVLAYALVTKPREAGLPYRIGTVQVDKDKDEQMPVITLDSATFKIVEREAP